MLARFLFELLQNLNKSHVTLTGCTHMPSRNKSNSEDGARLVTNAIVFAGKTTIIRHSNSNEFTFPAKANLARSSTDGSVVTRFKLREDLFYFPFA